MGWSLMAGASLKYPSTSLVASADNLTSTSVNKSVLDLLKKLNETNTRIDDLSPGTTTGIYDSGTTSSGNWIRYVDGTMTCWGSITATSKGTPGQFTTLLHFNVATIAFPQVFLTLPTVTSSILQPFGNANDAVGGSITNLTTSGCNIGGYIGVDAFQTLTWIAMGRWANATQGSPNTYNVVGNTAVAITCRSGPLTATVNVPIPLAILSQTGKGTYSSGTFTVAVAGTYLMNIHGSNSSSGANSFWTFINGVKTKQVASFPAIGYSVSGVELVYANVGDTLAFICDATQNLDNLGSGFSLI